MSNSTGSPPRPAAPANGGTMPRRGVVLLVDLAPPSCAPLAARLGGLGADVVALDDGGSDAAADGLAGALALLARRAELVPGEAADLAGRARALLRRRRTAVGAPVVVHGRLVGHLLGFFLAAAGLGAGRRGEPDLPGAAVLAGWPDESCVELPRAGTGERARRLGRAERAWRQALAQLEGTPVFVLPAPGTLDEAGAARLAGFAGLDPRPAAQAPAPAPRPPGGGDLAGTLAGLAGGHECFRCPPLPPESLLAAAVGELEAEAGQLAAGLAWTARQLEPVLRAELPEEAGASSVELAGGAGGAGGKDAGEAGPYLLSASEDRAAYHDWLRARRRPTCLEGPAPSRAATAPPRRGAAPVVSVLVPVHRTPAWALERCIGSVLAQDLAAWELCVCDDGSNDAGLSARLAAHARSDPRIKVAALPEPGGISAATNGALDLATGELVTFLDHDDELAPFALRLVAGALAQEPEADVIYTDEDKIDGTGERYDPFFKPAWSPDLLLSYAYLAHLTAIRRRLVVELGGLRSAFDGSQDWDLALRATEAARHVVHVPDVCYHWRALAGSTSSGAAAKPWAFEAGTRVLQDAIDRRGGGEVEQSSRFPGRYHVRRALAARPLVSAVIPFRDEPALLATCASSLRAAAGYDPLELVLVDNGSELPETAELLERLGAEPGVRVVKDPGPFNWAAINNAAARAAGGDVLLFANNDIEARKARWLHAMVGHALRPEVGAVGARLLYPDGTIQHAGVVTGLGGVAGHVLRGLPAEVPGYASMAISTRNCSVVTGACMMVRRDLFESVGGFDEELAVAFNDVDFCLRLREKGYLVVYEPLAELVHHESRSRGHTDDLAEGARVVERWAPAIIAGDPYLNPNLSHWRYWCPLSTAQEDYRWKTYLETSMSTPRSSSST